MRDEIFIFGDQQHCWSQILPQIKIGRGPKFFSQHLRGTDRGQILLVQNFDIDADAKEMDIDMAADLWMPYSWSICKWWPLDMLTSMTTPPIVYPTTSYRTISGHFDNSIQFNVFSSNLNSLTDLIPTPYSF